MSYSVEFTEESAHQIKKLDKSTRIMIYNWLNKHLEGTDNPRSSGHALGGKFRGLWRYRVNDYRLIVKIEEDKLLILVLMVGHRSKIYTHN